MFKTGVFVLATLVLSFGSVARADDTEEKGIAFVEKLGGKVIRDEKMPGNPVVNVSRDASQITDAGLKEIAALKNLTSRQQTSTGLRDQRVATPPGGSGPRCTPHRR